MSMAGLEPRVVEVLRQHLANRPALRKVLYETRLLFEFMRLRGVEHICAVTTALVAEWLWQTRLNKKGEWYRPAQATAKNRQWIALLVFKAAAELGAPINPLKLTGERIRLSDQVVPIRALTDEEHQRVEIFADNGVLGQSSRPVLVACAKAGGSPEEIAGVRMRDIDIEAGTVTFTGKAARVNRFDHWGKHAVRVFFANNPPFAADDLVCLTPRTAASRVAESVTARLRRVLVDAGLAGRPGVTVRSIRFAAARKVFEAEGIEAAARFLGTPSLDTAADAVGYDWRAVDG